MDPRRTRVASRVPVRTTAVFANRLLDGEVLSAGSQSPELSGTGSPARGDVTHDEVAATSARQMHPDEQPRQSMSMDDAEPDPLKAGSTLRFRIEDRARG